MLYLIASTVKNYALRPDYKKHGPFSDIFFDKFKNLLDDYIVNYQIKYFFYLLFISFFYLELSESMFQLLHNYSPYHLSIFGSFFIDFCYSFFHIGIVDFVYSFFAFHLHSFGHFVSLISNYDFTCSIIVMTTIICLLAYFCERYRSEKDVLIKVFFVYFLIYSFFFFLLVYFNVVSLNFYIFFTLCCYAFMAVNGVKCTKVDIIIASCILSTIILPYYVVLLLFIVLSYLGLNRDVPLIANRAFTMNDFKFIFYDDLLLIFVLAFFIVPLDYASCSPMLFILNSFPFMIFTLYIFRHEEFGHKYDDCSLEDE